MAKKRSKYICDTCGYESSGWLGKCPSCSEWNSFREEIDEPMVSRVGIRKIVLTGINDIRTDGSERMETGIGEMNRVLGGGLVKGSIVLVGGDPGIGKSTVLLQLCKKAVTPGEILYISGEESLAQLGIRARRLGVVSDKLKIAAETDLESIVDCIEDVKPSIAIIDSIQTVYSSRIPSVPGSATQIRNSTLAFMEAAKKLDVSIFLVGHVTKEGSLAGPKILEHMVDTVLYFEGDRSNNFRILRAVKNRFGSTNEIGVFEMTNNGLEEVSNPSAMMLSGRNNDACGSCVIPTLEGTRPVLVEIQALVCASAYAVPRRMSTGIDQNRATMLTGVLEKVMGIMMGNCDVYVNAAGGIKVVEPACDLAIVCSVASSFKGKPVDKNAVIMGEIGLTGEVRAVSNVEKRIKEAEKMGFEYAVVPAENAKAASKAAETIKIVAVRDARQALDAIFVSHIGMGGKK
ncbi:MAG: DNA repair protein RadA [Clostridia bacterium]